MMGRWLLSVFLVGISLVSFGASAPSAFAGAKKNEPGKENLCRLPEISTPTQKGLPNVVILAVDTLRADRLSLYGHDRETSPNLDRLGRDSLVFDRAIAPAPWTTPSFAGVFTGRHPGELGIGFDPLPLPEEIPTLAEELSSRGYATAGIVSHFFIGTKYKFNRGFGFWDQRYAGGHATVSSDGVSGLASDCLDVLVETDRPFFLFAHFFDPHYDYLEHQSFPFSEGYEGELHSGGDNFEELRSMAKTGQLTAQDREYLFDLYDSEVAFTDSRIGLLIDKLRDAGVYDDTLIIFVADHGEMFGERNDRWIGHTQFLFDELIRIPLVVKLPHAEGQPPRIGRIEKTVSLVDLMPSTLKLIDPSYSASRSVFPDSKGNLSDLPVFSQTRRWRDLDAMYEGPWKLVYDRKTHRPLLYNLETDPGERRNVAQDHPKRLAKMREELDLWKKALGVGASKVSGQVAPTLTGEEMEKLRSLGYIR